MAQWWHSNLDYAFLCESYQSISQRQQNMFARNFWLMIKWIFCTSTGVLHLVWRLVQLDPPPKKLTLRCCWCEQYDIMKALLWKDDHKWGAFKFASIFFRGSIWIRVSYFRRFGKTACHSRGQAFIARLMCCLLDTGIYLFIIWNALMYCESCATTYKCQINVEIFYKAT